MVKDNLKNAVKSDGQILISSKHSYENIEQVWKGNDGPNEMRQKNSMWQLRAEYVGQVIVGGKNMYWSGQRPYYSKHKNLTLKLGQNDLQMYFQFYSRNNGLDHWGRSTIQTMQLVHELDSDAPVGK